jgi:hypothetical protein
MTDHQTDEQRDPKRPGDDEFASAAGQLLRQSADELDAATAARLNRARQAALDQLDSGRSRAPWLLPALSTAAVGVLAVALWVSQGNGPGSGAPAGVAIESAADLDLLLADDNLEMLEDLDFYAWLDADLSDDELRAELESAS